MIDYEVNPTIESGELYGFYERNNICEAGYGRDVATIPLKHSSVIVAAVEAGELVGIARAMFDGLDASVHELSLDLRLQGQAREGGNGSLIASDPQGVARQIATTLLRHLFAQGCYFISVDIVEGVEEPFYKRLGLVRNDRMIPYVLDRRPYVDQPGATASEGQARSCSTPRDDHR